MALPTLAEGLRESLVADRIHSAYLFSGPGEAPRDGALAWGDANRLSWVERLH